MDKKTINILLAFLLLSARHFFLTKIEKSKSQVNCVGDYFATFVVGSHLLIDFKIKKQKNQ